MSVVVRMEMPENCCKCQLRQEDYDTGEEFCPFTGVECLSIGRQDNCPIICELPEGHGDLIDRNDFIKMWKKTKKKRVFISGLDVAWLANVTVPAEAESTSPKPTDPVPIRDVYYVMTECDAKTGTVTYEPRERIEP